MTGSTRRMPRSARVLTLLAALLLGVMFFTPVWRVRLVAPQYPEGLGMLIRLSTIEGVKEFDLRSINALNHYIGMKAIEPDDIPELKYMPWIVGGLVVTGLGVAILGRRRPLVGWTAAFALLAFGGLYDFWRWSYDYGHNLDTEHAIIIVPGMTYQPPLIGSKQLLNFTATSLPDIGGIAAGLAMALAVGAVVLSYRRSARLGLAGAGMLAGCVAAAPQLVLGQDSCERCHMLVADGRFGAVIVTSTGKQLKFDGVDCMIEYLDATPGLTTKSLWVADAVAPGTLVPAEQATYVIDGDLRAPMGTLVSFATAKDAESLKGARGRVVSWVELRARARQTIEVRPGRAPSIAEAVRLAHPGDRISIGRGVYRDTTIVVDRPLTIVGEPGAVLDGGAATHILRVEADDVTVRGLTFRNVSVSHVQDRAAIRVGEVRHCVIEDNRIVDAFFGIYLAGTVGCQVARNEIRGRARTEDGSGNGIHLWTAREIDVTDNRVSGHRDGIYLEFAHDARVVGNVSEGNIRYGLHFMYSDDCAYERNTFRANQAGVAVMYTRRVAMLDNRFEENWGPASYGLLLKEIYDSRLERNHFVRNTTGLLADGATRMIARGNVFSDNGWAVKLMASTQDAELTGNAFLRNTFDLSSNSRSSTATVRGNYWDEYRGYDLDRDGHGDVAHHPVRLFSLIVAGNEPTMVLLRSPLVALLDGAERVLPSLTPATLADPTPLMRRPR